MQEVELSVKKAQETTNGYQLLDNNLINKTDSTYWEIAKNNGIDLEANQDYCFNAYTSMSTIRVMEIGTNQELKSINDNKSLQFKFDTSKKIYFTIYKSPSIPENTKFLLTKGTEEKPYEPYTRGQPSPNPDYTQEINKIIENFDLTSCGKNLLPFKDGIDFTIGGVRIYTNNGNLYFDGTSSIEVLVKNQEYKNNLSFILDAGEYFLNKNNYSRAVSLIEYDTDNIIKNNKGSFILDKKTKCYIGFYIRDNVFNEEEEKIMLTKGTEATAYEPYQAITNTINLNGNEILPYDKVKLEFVIPELKPHIKLYKNSRYLELKISDMNNSEGFPGWEDVPYIKEDFPNVSTNLDSLTDYYSNINIKENNLIAINTNNNHNILYFRNSVIDLTQTQWKEQYPNLILKLCYKSPNILEVIDLGTIDDMNMTYNPITNVSTSIDNVKAKVKYYRDFIYTIRNMEIDNNTLQAQLNDLESRVSALETAPTTLSIQEESEVVDNA